VEVVEMTDLAIGLMAMGAFAVIVVIGTILGILNGRTE